MLVCSSKFSMLHMMTALYVVSGQVFSDDQQVEKTTNKGVSSPDHNVTVAGNGTQGTSFDDAGSRWTSRGSSLRNGGHGDLFLGTSPAQGETTDVFQASHSDVRANSQNDLTHADILTIAQGVMSMTDASNETKWIVPVPLNQNMDRAVPVPDNPGMEHDVKPVPDNLDMEHGFKSLPDNPDIEHGVKSVPDKNKEIEQINFSLPASYARSTERRPTTGSLDVGIFKTSGSASARTLLADDSDVIFMGRPSSRNTTPQGESIDEMILANNDGSSKLLQSDGRNDFWPTVESLTSAENVSALGKDLGVFPSPEPVRIETNRNTGHETNEVLHTDLPSFPAAELKSYSAEVDSRIGSERGSEPHTVRNVELSSDVQGHGVLGKRMEATYGFHGNDHIKRFLDLDRQLELYKKEARDNATAEQLSSQLNSSGAVEKPNDLVEPKNQNLVDRLDILQTDGGHLYLWMTDAKDTPAKDSSLESKQLPGDILMYNSFHDNDSGNREADQHSRNEQLVPTERLSPLMSTGDARNDVDVRNNDPMPDSVSPYERRPQAPAPPQFFQSNLSTSDLGPGMKQNNHMESRQDNQMGNQQANQMGSQQDNHMGNQQDNQMYNQQANQMDNQQDNQMDNQQANQMDNQQDNKMGNQQANQMGNQQDNRMGNQQDNRMGNQQDNRMGNQQDNRMGNQQDNHMGNQQDNHMGNQQDNHMGNQQANQMGNQQDNRMGNQQANQMGNQQDNRMANQQDNQMDNQQANQMGNQQDNRMANQQDNQMDNQQANQMGNQQDNRMGYQQANRMGYQQANRMGNQQANQMGNQQANQMGNQQEHKGNQQDSNMGNHQDKQMGNHQDNQMGNPQDYQMENQPNKHFDKLLNQGAIIQDHHQGNQIIKQESSHLNQPPGLTPRDEAAETQRQDNGRSSFLETLDTPQRHLDRSSVKPYQQLDAILTNPPQQLDAIISNPPQQLGPILTNPPQQLDAIISNPFQQLGPILTNQPQQLDAILSNQPQQLDAILSNPPQQLDAILSNQPQQLDAILSNPPQQLDAIISNPFQQLGPILANQPQQLDAILSNQPQQLDAILTNPPQQLDAILSNSPKSAELDLTRDDKPGSVAPNDQTSSLGKTAANSGSAPPHSPQQPPKQKPTHLLSPYEFNIFLEKVVLPYLQDVKHRYQPNVDDATGQPSSLSPEKGGRATGPSGMSVANRRGQDEKRNQFFPLATKTGVEDHNIQPQRVKMDDFNPVPQRRYDIFPGPGLHLFNNFIPDKQSSERVLYYEPGPRVHFNGLSPMNQFNEPNPMTQFNEPNLMDQFNEPNHMTQFNEPNLMDQFNEPNHMNQFIEPNPMIKFNEPNHMTQFNEPKLMTQFNERNPMTQFKEEEIPRFSASNFMRFSHNSPVFQQPLNLRPGDYQGPSNLRPGDYQGPSNLRPGDYQGPSNLRPGDYQGPSNLRPGDYQQPFNRRLSGDQQPFNLRPGDYQQPFNRRLSGDQQPFNLQPSGYQVATEIKPTGSHAEPSPHGYVPYTQIDPYAPKPAPLQVWEQRPRLSESYDTQQWVWLNGDSSKDPHKGPPTAEYKETSRPTMKELVDELLRSYSRKRHSNLHELNMASPPLDRSILTHVPESSKLPRYDHLDHSNLPVFQSDVSFSIPADVGGKGANHQAEFPAQNLKIPKKFTPWEPPVGISSSKKTIPENRSSLLTPQLYKARLSDGDIKPSLQARPKLPQNKDKHSRPFFSPRRHQTQIRTGSTKADEQPNKTSRTHIDYNTPVTSTSRKQPTSDQHVPIPLSRYYRSRDSAHNNINSLNQRFRNKKLFLSQQFQMFNDEKFQVKKQMAGLEQKKISRVQVLPWGISVQPQQNDIYELSEGHSVELPSYLSRSPSPQFEPSFEPRDPGMLFGHDQSGQDKINLGLPGDEDSEATRQRAEIGPQQITSSGSGVDLGTEHETKAGLQAGQEDVTEAGTNVGRSTDTVVDNLDVAGIELQINNSTDNFTEVFGRPENSTDEIDLSLSRVNDTIVRGQNSSQVMAEPRVTMSTPPQTIDAAERNLSSSQDLFMTFLGANMSDQRIDDIQDHGRAMAVGQGDDVTSGAVHGSNTADGFGSLPNNEEIITDLKLIREPMHTDSGHSVHTDSGHSASRLKRDAQIIPWYKLGAVRSSSRAGGNDRRRQYNTRAKREKHITEYESRVPLVAVNTASSGDKLIRKRRAVVKMAAYKTRWLPAREINDVTQNGGATLKNIPSWISPGATLINGDQTSDGGHGYQNNPGKYEQGAHRAPPGNLMPTEEQRTGEAKGLVVAGNFTKTEGLRYDVIADDTPSSQDRYRYAKLKEKNTDRLEEQNADRFEEQNVDISKDQNIEIFRDQKIDRSMRSNQQNQAIDRLSARVTQEQSVKQRQYNFDQQQESRAQKQRLASQRGSDPEEAYDWSGLAPQDSTNQNIEAGTSDEPGGPTAPRGNSYADRYLQNQKLKQSTVSRQTRIHNPFVHTQGQLPYTYTDNSYPPSQAYTHKDQDTLASPDAVHTTTDVAQRASPPKSRPTFQSEPADYPTDQGLDEPKQTSGPETANLRVSPDSTYQHSEGQTSYVDRFLSLKNPYGVAPTQPMVVHYQPYVMYYTYPYGYVSGDPSYTDEYNPSSVRYREDTSGDKSGEEDKAGEEDKEEDEDEEKRGDEQSQAVYDNRDNQYTGTKQGYNGGYTGTKQGYNGGYSGVKQGYSDGYAGTEQGYNDGYVGTKQGYGGGYTGNKQGYNDGYTGTQQRYDGGYTGIKQGYNDGYVGTKQGYDSGYTGIKQGYNDGYAGTKQRYDDSYTAIKQWYNDGYVGTKLGYDGGYIGIKQGYNDGYDGTKQGYNDGYAGTKQGYNNAYAGTKQSYNDGYAGARQGFNNGYASIKQDYNDGYSSTKQSYRDKYFSTKKSYEDGYAASGGYGNTYPNGRTQVSNTGPANNFWLDKTGKKWNPNSYNNNLWNENAYSNNLWGKKGYNNNNGWVSNSKNNRLGENNKNLGYWSKASYNTNGHKSYNDPPVWGQNTYSTGGWGQNGDYRNNYHTKGQYNPRFIRGTRKQGGKFVDSQIGGPGYLGRFDPNTHNSGSRYYQRGDLKSSTGHDLDEDAVLQFVLAQKKFNSPNPGMTSDMGHGASPSSSFYQVPVYGSKTSETKGGHDDRVAEEAVEHFLYTKPRYGKKADGLLGGILNI